MAQLILEEGAGLISLDAVEIEYSFFAGSAERPTIVLLHEGLGSVSLWRDFPQALAKSSGAPVFTYSRVGYGKSSPCDLPRPLRYMEDEAQEFLPGLLARLSARRLVLFGHSDGGSIAAVNAGAIPDPRLAGIILMAPHFFTEEVCVTAITETNRLYAETALRERLARHHGANVDCAFRGWADTWLHPDFLKWDLTPFLPKITVPTLLIQGEDDEYGTRAQVDTAERLIPAPTALHMLPDCGHSPHKDQRERVLALASAFVAAL